MVSDDTRSVINTVERLHPTMKALIAIAIAYMAGMSTFSLVDRFTGVRAEIDEVRQEQVSQSLAVDTLEVEIEDIHSRMDNSEVLMERVVCILDQQLRGLEPERIRQECSPAIFNSSSFDLTPTLIGDTDGKL